MTLRDHPLMISGGKSVWLPVWVEKYSTTRLAGEIGTLTHLGNNACSSNEIFAAHHPQRLTILRDTIDPRFRVLSARYELLRKHIGHTIKEIGDLDLAHLLQQLDGWQVVQPMRGDLSGGIWIQRADKSLDAYVPLYEAEVTDLSEDEMIARIRRALAKAKARS